jgi:hypothetical protein
MECEVSYDPLERIPSEIDVLTRRIRYPFSSRNQWGNSLSLLAHNPPSVWREGFE